MITGDKYVRNSNKISKPWWLLLCYIISLYIHQTCLIHHPFNLTSPAIFPSLQLDETDLNCKIIEEKCSTTIYPIVGPDFTCNHCNCHWYNSNCSLKFRVKIIGFSCLVLIEKESSPSDSWILQLSACSILLCSNVFFFQTNRIKIYHEVSCRVSPCV